PRSRSPPSLGGPGAGTPLASLRLCSYGLSGLGAAAMLLGFLGCLGALKELRAMLGLYFGFLLLLLTAQVTVAVIVYTQRAALAAQVAAYAEQLIRGYPARGPPGDPQESWDAVQHQLGCCGWTGPQDWEQQGDTGGDIACSCLRAPNSTQGTPWVLPRGRCPAAAPQDIFPTLSLLMLSMFLLRNLDSRYEKLLRGL
ncbi:leukocyte antigen CD37, partial [Passer montanus]|uniref:leukocyte antigen CD37 n=1 Tax=Passer montanus TaxID=9160 RepID=UPI0019616BE3